MVRAGRTPTPVPILQHEGSTFRVLRSKLTALKSGAETQGLQTHDRPFDCGNPIRPAVAGRRSQSHPNSGASGRSGGATYFASGKHLYRPDLRRADRGTVLS